MPPVNIEKVRDTRLYSGDEIWEIRGHRNTNMNPWKERIEKVDALYRGDWDVVFPDESATVDLPHVMNLVQVGLNDISSLVSEQMPSVKAFPQDETKTAQEAAYLRETISHTYWAYNDGDLLIPLLSMDLAGAGGCFLVVTVQEGKPYPVIHRVDPRHAFPDVHNGKIEDLLVVQQMKVRQAQRLFGEDLIPSVLPEDADTVEVLEYYSEKECLQALSYNRNGEPVKYSTEKPVHIVRRWNPDIGRVPVAFAKLDSFDAEFRGMFDQIAGSLRTKNRIVKLLLDYTDQMTYAPFESKGLLNEDEVPGPGAHFRLDPNIQDARVGRVHPAGSSPQLFALLDYLDREQRGGAAYPDSRQGQVSQSIASASFVAATQGQLSSAVRNIQRLLGRVREEMNEISFKLDEKHLDESKPLVIPMGRKKTYMPSKDIGGVYDTVVVYGAGAGLDRLNADVRILQHMGARLISRETGREQLEYLDERAEEQDKIERELAREAVAQKFFGEAPWDLIAEVVVLMEKGEDMLKAIDAVMAPPERKEGPTPDLSTPNLTSGQGLRGPRGTATERERMEKGATQVQEAEEQGTLAGPPLSDLVLNQSGG